MREELELVLKAQTQEAEDALKRVKSQTNELSNSLSNFGNVAEGVLGAISTYAGAQGLMGLVRAYDDANKMLVRAQFHLRSLGGDTAKNLGVLKQWGAEVQRNIGIGDEYAVLIASRLTPVAGSLNKAQEWANTLLEIQRIGVLDAESASLMLMRANEGGAQALNRLAWQLGLTLHGFESMDTIMALIQDRVEGLTEQLTPFNQEMAILKLELGELVERAGRPLASILGSILKGVNDLIVSVPLLGKVFEVVAPMIASALMMIGLAGFLDSLLGISTALKVSKLAFSFWAGAIAIVFGIIILLYKSFSKDTQVFLDWITGPEGFMVIATALYGLGLLIGGPIYGILAAALGSIAILFASMVKEGYEPTWEGFKKYWNDTWDGIYLHLIDWGKKFETSWNEYWTGLYLIIKDVFQKITNFITERINWIRQEVENIRRKLTEIAQPVVSPIGQAMGRVGEFVGRVLPRRQFGGYIPETGIYMLHRGEMVAPAGRIGGAGAISLNIYGNTFMADEEGAVKIGDMIIRTLQRQHRI